MDTTAFEESAQPVTDKPRAKRAKSGSRRRRSGGRSGTTSGKDQPKQVDVIDVVRPAEQDAGTLSSAVQAQEEEAPKKSAGKRRAPRRRKKKSAGGGSPDSKAELDAPNVNASSTADTASSTDTLDAEQKAPRRRGGKRRQAARSGSKSPREEPSNRLGEETKADKNAPRGRQSADAGEIEGSTKGDADRQMLINISAGDECRIAVLHKGRLEELFIERTATQSHVGNIYKGVVTNVEPSIQAVFVDFGLPQHGFLHISDVQPQYFPDHKGELEEVGRKIPRHHRPPIQKCFRRGQEVIVQVSKEGLGTKGPTLTTYLAIPGRFLVMMPGMNRHGVSRKIEDEEERRSMRDLMGQLDLPTSMGFIMRTAGLGRTKREVQRDLNYLLRLWKTVAERTLQVKAPSELYEESDLVIRTIRDLYTSDFSRIVVDDVATVEKARAFLQLAMPRSSAQVDLHSDGQPLFHSYGVEAEIERINVRHVPLPCGGSLVIDSTEALVAIDVNSGKYRKTDDAEESAYEVNVEAAEEIARQLRLRDLGGLIICDFIDMRQDRHKRGVERALRDALKIHKERARILRMSQFGLIEMTRQRQGPSMKRNIFYDCPHCGGSGLVKMPESVVLDVMRVIQLALHHKSVRKVLVTVSPAVAFQILNEKRIAISQIEEESKKTVVISGDPNFTSDQVDYVCQDGRGRQVQAVPSILA